MCVGYDGSPVHSSNPQVISCPQKPRSDSTGWLGEGSVSGLAQKRLQSCGVICYFLSSMKWIIAIKVQGLEESGLELCRLWRTFAYLSVK